MLTTYSELIDAMPADAGSLVFPIAKTDSGRAKFIDLAAAPHGMIAGVTGSGKSVALNVAISTIIARNEGAVEFVMIDPKRVELRQYRGAPGVKAVITDMNDAADALREVEEMMDARYARFEESKVKTLAAHNAATGENIPITVLVVDEVSDLMDTHAKSVLPILCRIGQLGRAAGIHMLLATQRPAADTIPKKLLANVPLRIALLCQSDTESRLILGSSGAEDLAGNGDMLMRVPGEKGLTRGQGPYLADDEIADMIGAVEPEVDDVDEIDEPDAPLNVDELDDDDLAPEPVDEGEKVDAIGRLLADVMSKASAASNADEVSRLEAQVAELRAQKSELAARNRSLEYTIKERDWEIEKNDQLIETYRTDLEKAEKTVSAARSAVTLSYSGLTTQPIGGLIVALAMLACAVIGNAFIAAVVGLVGFTIGFGLVMHGNNTIRETMQQALDLVNDKEKK